MTTTRAPSSALTSFVVASRYMPVYLAILLLAIADRTHLLGNVVTQSRDFR